MHAIELPSMQFRHYFPCIILLIGFAAGGQQSDDSTDKNDLVIDDAGTWRLVQAHCTSCHSVSLLTQQRLDRSGWRRSIRRMQEQENLWDLGEQEPLILDYLTEYYGVNDNEGDTRPRRPPLTKLSY